MKKSFLPFLFLGTLFVAPTVSAATIDLTPEYLMSNIASSLIFGAIGVLMAVIAFKVIDILTPGNLKKDLVEKQNIALAIVAGSMMLGICIIIAASIFG